MSLSDPKSKVLLQLDPDEHSADSALVDLVDFTYGPYEESDGMAGGGGGLA